MQVPNFTYDRMKQFLRSPFYEHWTSFLRYSNDSEDGAVSGERVDEREDVSLPDCEPILGERSLREYVYVGNSDRSHARVEGYR